MITSPIFRVNAQGIHAPSYAEILEYFTAQAKTIFGSDINLDADTQDGQLLAIFASAINDVNAQAIATYNQFNPNTAVGVGLDSAVKTNGIMRNVATYSTVDVVLVGQAGTTINNGMVSDDFGNNWMLPSQVIIPVSGQITVTATAENVGAVEASPNSITTIETPTRGWQSVTNPQGATVGIPVETDAQLRQRQNASTTMASQSVWEGILSTVANLTGVTQVAGIRNDTNETSSKGVPPHSIAVVVEGGDAQSIAQAIFLKKGEGVGTYGSTSGTYTDSFGIVNTVNFTRPTQTPIFVTVTIKASPTYLTAVGDEIKQRIVDYINGLSIGKDVVITRVLAEAIMGSGCVVDTSYQLEAIKMGTSASSQSTATIPIAWNQDAVCSLDNVVIEVSDDTVNE